MHPELFLLIGISLSLGFTPGPNNAVASFSGFNFGIKKTIPLILGVWLGYTAFVVLTNFALISTFIKYPIIQEIIRFLGTFFLIYLAYKISFSSLSKEDEKLIINKLESQTGKKITLITSVDKSLIGGLLIRINDRIVDNTIKASITRMAREVYDAKVW